MPLMSVEMRPQVTSRKSQAKFLVSFYLFSFIFCFFTSASAYEHPRYEIEAKFDSSVRRIEGTEKVTYTNNSDQTLSEIYFHIYPHRKYSKKEIKKIYRYGGYFKINPFPEGFQSGDLEVESVAASGEPLKFNVEGADETLLKVSLAKKLSPSETVELELKFYTDIPHAYGRFGWHKGIFTLMRWYPILSVFDNDGWHNYPFYVFHQPFFSEAAYYKVKLTLLKDETVAASAVLKNEVYNSEGTKTLFWEGDLPLREFALGISRDYKVCSFKQDKININVYYLKGGERKAEDAARFAAGLMRFYTERFGDYPYAEFNIVLSYLGYGGVQSSGLVFIDTRVFKLPEFLIRYFHFLIAHEAGHQWFYNLVGSDEYKEMFLDEGMNSFWILKYLEDCYGPDAKVLSLPKALGWFIPNFSFRQSTVFRYMFLAKNGYDRPIVGELTGFHEPSSIFALTYGKGAAVLEMLEYKIGKELFLKIMRRYTQEYRFKNIGLKDFIRISEEESGQKLDEFFNQWLKTDKKADFAVKKVRPNELILENRLQQEMEVEVKLKYAGGESETILWDGRGKVFKVDLRQDKKLQEVIIDPEQKVVLDLDRTNNYWPRRVTLKPVPLYYFAYEIPVFYSPNAYNTVLGPTVGGSTLGAAASINKPQDAILKISSDYDFNHKASDSKVAWELSHLGGRQLALGFELFDYSASKDNQDLTGGKLYLRQELWPASYGLFDLNDHISYYLIRNTGFDRSAANLNSAEGKNDFYYRKKDEAILGISGSFGRYGPYPDPDYGFIIIPTQEVGGHFFGGKESFWRTSVELNNYQLILPKYQHKVASRLKVGWGEKDNNLFQLGGPQGLRGYSLKTIEGARVLLGGLEYRFPLKTEMNFYCLKNMLNIDKIQGVVFTDAGKAWFDGFSKQDFKQDVGVGLRVHFDIFGFVEKGILRFDLAKAIGEPKESAHFWLGLSQAF